MIVAEATIDKLQIEIVGKDSNATTVLKDTISALNKLKTTSNKIASANTNIEKLANTINSIKAKNLSKLSNLFSTISSVQKINISAKLATRITEIGEAVKTLDGADFSKLNEMASGLRALSNVGTIKTPRLNIGTNKTDKVGTTTPSFSGTTSQTMDISEESVSRANRFSDLLSSIKDKLSSAASAARNFGSQVKTAFSSSIIGKFVSKIKQTITALGRIALYRFMRTIIRNITDAFSTGINNMYQYSLTFSGSFASSMDKAASALLSFKNSLAAAVAPLIEYFVPYLDKAVDKLMEINNTIAMVIAGLTGKTTYSKAVRVTTTYADAADKAAKNTTKVKEAVDELSRSFAGLDEITVIGDIPNNGNNSSSLANAADEASSNYALMFEEAPVNMEKVQRIKEILEGILKIAGLIGAAIAAWNFTKALTGIKGLNSALTLAGIALTLTGVTLLIKGVKNVITDGMDWENFWTLFFGAGALTTGTTILGKVLSRVTGNTKWTGTGFRVGAGIGGAAMIFSGLYDTLTNTLDNGKGTLESTLTSYFSSVIGGALLGTAISPGIGTAIGAVGGAIVNGISFYLSNPKSVEQVKNALSNGALGDKVKVGLFYEMTQRMGLDAETSAKITNWFTNSWVNPLQDIYTAWSGAKTWFDNNIISPVTSFFSNLGVNISGFFSGAWESIKGTWNSVTGWFDTNIIQPVGKFFEGLWTGISQGVSNAWTIISAVWITVSTWFDTNVIQPVGKFFFGLWKDIYGFFSKAWEDVKAVWDKVSPWFNVNVITPVGNFFSGLWTNISNFFSNAWNDVKEVWGTVSSWFDKNICQPVKYAFETVTNKISGFFTNLWNGVKEKAANAINWVIGGIESGINGMISGINWFIQKFNSIGEWASNVTGIEFYYINEIQPVNLGRVSFAKGGFPEDGFFFANSNELVGQFSNGRTAVANNEQIIEGIAEGVESANEEQNRLLREQNNLLRALLSKDNTINVSSITSAYIRQNQRNGVATVPIGTV